MHTDTIHQQEENENIFLSGIRIGVSSQSYKRIFAYIPNIILMYAIPCDLCTVLARWVLRSHTFINKIISVGTFAHPHVVELIQIVLQKYPCFRIKLMFSMYAKTLL